jgi:hypothetical protein
LAGRAYDQGAAGREYVAPPSRSTASGLSSTRPPTLRSSALRMRVGSSISLSFCGHAA